ncbi:hypothetical protein A7Q01_00360 [Eikenella sp. NML96-A-049]|nr:hypothetical protein A7P97_08715 [Eikenella sp. NML070372]OAM43174.1 hypothetical protein A7Q01_00360 [Eikenella sp. NML96-A-049]
MWLPEKFVSIDCRVEDTYQISGSLLIPALFAFAPYAGAGHFLVFASPKKGDCGHRFGFAKLPSLHVVFRAGSQLAAAPLQACKPLFPEKPRSVRLHQQASGQPNDLVVKYPFSGLLDVQIKGYLKTQAATVFR